MSLRLQRVILVVGALMAVAVAPAAAAQRVDVAAAGNPFTGGLAFDPSNVTVSVGTVVRWTNTDFLVPHTATEVHQLWNLTGDYPSLPPFPNGFGPGESRERAFEAGTQHYLCEVHPAQMRGVVAVPVVLAVESRRVRSRGSRRHRPRSVRYVRATWASQAPAAGEVFDVQRRHPGGEWSTWREGTRDPSGSFRTGSSAWEVRARLRRADDRAKATDWSPVASIRG